MSQMAHLAVYCVELGQFGIFKRVQGGKVTELGVGVLLWNVSDGGRHGGEVQYMALLGRRMRDSFCDVAWRLVWVLARGIGHRPVAGTCTTICVDVMELFNQTFDVV